MLDENKKIYEQVANTYTPEWKDLDKNEIIRLASIHKGNKREGYISAAILCYWSKLGTYYYKAYLVACPEDIHEWLVESIMYAVNKHPWTDPSKNIFNDPNGPDKVVNRCMESRRLTFYQQLNRYKRSINSAILSLDTLTDEYKDVCMPGKEDTYSIEIQDLVLNFWKEEQYLKAFIVDILVYEIYNEDDNLIKRLFSFLKHIDNMYLTQFANRYNIPFEQIQKEAVLIKELHNKKLNKRILYEFLRIKDILKKEINLVN